MALIQGNVDQVLECRCISSGQLYHLFPGSFLLVPAGGGGLAWQPVLSRGRVHYVLPFHTAAEVGARGNTSILSDDIEQRVVASPCPWRRTWPLHSGVTRMRVLERSSQLDEVRPPVPLPRIRSQLPPTLSQGLFLSLTQVSHHCVLVHDSVLLLMLFLLPEMLFPLVLHHLPHKGSFDSSDLGLKIYPFFSQAAEILVAETDRQMRKRTHNCTL